MFKALKMKIAARKLNRKSNKKHTETKQTSLIGRIFNAIFAPFRAIWNWVCSIDLIGLINITLLCAIIVLFSMLVLDIIEYNKKPVVIIAKQNSVPTPAVTETKPVETYTEPKEITTIKVATLPMARNSNHELIEEPINVEPKEIDYVAIKQTARMGSTMFGDVIIDHRGAAAVLSAGDTIKGNLYLQNMRKYVLPRGIRIEGNLFVRDLGMLQFAGKFTVTGNIYVTPNSSFGPLPRNARIGGQVIL